MKTQSTADRARIEAAAEANLAANRKVIDEYQALAGMSASGQAAYRASFAKGRDVGIKTERERVRGILTCSEATGRTAMARQFAFETDVDLETAKKMLAVAARETGDNPFFAAMAKLGNPNVGIDGDGPLDGTRISTTTEMYARRARDRESYISKNGKSAAAASS